MFDSIQGWCAAEVDKEGNYHDGMAWGTCDSGCPSKDDAFTSDNTLKVTHSRIVDEKEIMISARLIGVMSSSLILLALMMKGLGISGSEI